MRDADLVLEAILAQVDRDYVPAPGGAGLVARSVLRATAKKMAAQETTATEILSRAEPNPPRLRDLEKKMSNLPNCSGRIYADVGEYHIETNYNDRRATCTVTSTRYARPVYYESESFMPDSNLAYKTALQLHDKGHAFVAQQQRLKFAPPLQFPESAWALFDINGKFSHFTPSREAAENMVKRTGYAIPVRITEGLG